MDVRAVIRRFEELADPKNIEGMARFGIKPKACYGVVVPELRALAKRIGKDHELALKLWAIDTRETRILASMIDDAAQVTEEQMEAWIKDFDYWEIVDQVVMNVFGWTPFAYKKAIEWCDREPEFERRTAFVLMARLALQEKKAEDLYFEPFFPLIVKASSDDRAGVKKAVNWALRQIGKRNLSLNRKALEIARKIRKMDSPSAKWIAADAIRELEDPKILKTVEKRDTSLKKAR